MEEGNWAIMKKTHTEAELDSLLDRGGIGAARRDAILATVLADVQAERPSPWRRRCFIAVLGLAGAATALLLVTPRISPRPSAFRAKGPTSNPSVMAPAAHIECLGAPIDACPLGSLVIVRVAGVRGFVSAWAEPVGGGERIWYFSADSFSPQVDALSTTSIVTSRAVRIGPEHSAGSYVVQIRVTERPMQRDDLLRGPSSAMLAQGQALLTVTLP